MSLLEIRFNSTEFAIKNFLTFATSAEDIVDSALFLSQKELAKTPFD